MVLWCKHYTYTFCVYFYHLHIIIMWAKCWLIRTNVPKIHQRIREMSYPRQGNLSSSWHNLIVRTRVDQYKYTTRYICRIKQLWFYVTIKAISRKHVGPTVLTLSQSPICSRRSSNAGTILPSAVGPTFSNRLLKGSKRQAMETMQALSAAIPQLNK